MRSLAEPSNASLSLAHSVAVAKLNWSSMVIGAFRADALLVAAGISSDAKSGEENEVSASEKTLRDWLRQFFRPPSVLNSVMCVDV